MDTIYSFNNEGLYTGSSPRPVDPVRGTPAAINPFLATLVKPPAYNLETQHVRMVDGKWVIEDLEIAPEPPTPTKQTPRYFGNEKLDLFTLEEQLTVVTATMTDPVVKLTYDRFIGAAYLTIEDPEVEVGLSMLVGKGLITQESKNSIVAKMRGE